jgi:hypothetical protein
MLAIFISLAMCFGCADDRAESWVGHRLDDLIRAWGPPSASATLTDGSKIVDWSLNRTFREPYRHSDGAGGTYSNNISQHCVVRIEANAQDIIVKAKVEGNLGGCNTLFRDKPAAGTGS